MISRIFSAPNPGITQRTCGRLIGGGHTWGLPHALGGQHLRPQCWGIGGGSAGAAGLYFMGECGEGGWVPGGDVAPLSWWFSVGLVSASASSGNLSLLVWANSTVGRKMALISSTKTLYIVSCCWCVPQGPALWPSLWVRFRLNQHIQSCCLPLQNRQPTWRHCQVRRVV